MNSVAVQLFYTIETSLIFSLVTVGLYLSFRVLRFPDLTAEGGFGLAALLGGMAAVKFSSPWLGLLVGAVVGMLAGAVTAFLANTVRLPTILASILTMTMCFSVGILIAGQPHQPLAELWTFAPLSQLFNSTLQAGVVGGGLFLLLTSFVLIVILRSGGGLLLRVRGENPGLCKELGHSLLTWDVLGLALANGVVGIGAVLLSQSAGYANINQGRGVAISALAAIMLAEAVFPNRRIEWAFAACVLATFVIQLVRLVALNLGLPDGTLDLVTSLLVICFVWVSNLRSKTGRSLLEQIRM